MPGRRKTWRLVAVALLAVGVVTAACCAPLNHFQRWAESWLIGLMEPAPFTLADVAALRPSAYDEGTIMMSIDVRRADGAVETGKRSYVLGPCFRPWSRVLVRRGASAFALGEEVHPVGADGVIASAGEPLSADDRAHALLVTLTTGENASWFVTAYPPPLERTGRSADRAVADVPSALLPVPRNLTPPAVQGHRVAAAVVPPLAFVADVVTWPFQAAFYAYVWVVARPLVP